jgi:hypothetical protein
MSSKGKNTLFRRRNRDSVPAVEPTSPSSSSQREPPAEDPVPAPATSYTDPAPHNGGSHYRGADAINANTAKDIGDLKQSTSDGVRGDLQDDIGGISPGINGLLSPSEKKQGFELPQSGGHFLEPSVDHLHNDFLDRWKKEMLFPSIQRWVDVYLVEHVQNLLHKRTKHKQEIIELERAHKELLVTVVRKTWGEYEKKMANTRIVKQVHFGFHPSQGKESWGDDIHDVVPEVMEHVPRVYEPEVGLHDDPNPTEHHSRHGHGHHKHGDSTALDGHDPEGIYPLILVLKDSNGTAREP